MNILQELQNIKSINAIPQREAAIVALLKNPEFREHPELMGGHLSELIATLPTSYAKSRLLQRILARFLDADANSRFATFINPVWLIELAASDAALGAFILANETCTTIFLKDAQNFLTYFLVLAEKQTPLAFQYFFELWNNGVDQRTLLIPQGGPLFRSFLVHFFSHLDKVDSYYEWKTDWIETYKLIHDPKDAAKNIEILCKSKKAAYYILRRITSNKLYDLEDIQNIQYFQHISLAQLIEITTLQPDTLYLLIEGLLRSISRTAGSEEEKEYRSVLDQLLPKLSEQTDKGDLFAKLCKAKVLSYFAKTQPDSNQQEQEAISLASEVLAATRNQPEAGSILYFVKTPHRDAGQFLFELAEEKYKNFCENMTVSSYLYTAYGLLQMVATFSHKTSSYKNKANAKLNTPDFIFAVGHELEVEFDYDKAFKVYKTSRVDEPQGFDAEEQDRYRYHLAVQAQIQHHMANMISEALKAPEKYPQITLTISIEQQKKYPLIVAKLLLLIKDKVPGEMRVEYGKICLTLGIEAISLGFFSVGCALLFAVPEKTLSQEKAQNILNVLDSKLKKEITPVDLALTRGEFAPLLLEFYESAYAALDKFIANGPKDILFLGDSMPEASRMELTVLINTLRQQAHSIEGAKEGWLVKKPALSSALRRDIAKPHALKPAQEREATLAQKRLLQLQRFGFLPPVTKPRAAQWTRDAMGEWHKAGVSHKN